MPDAVFQFKPLLKASSSLPKQIKGYGLAMLLVFLGTSVAIGASLQLMSGPLTAIVMGSASQNRLAAEQLAKSGMKAVVIQLQNLYNTGQSIAVGPSFNSTASPAYAKMPQSPDSLAGATRDVGSYTSRVSYVNGNTLLVEVTATVGSSKASVSQLLNLTRNIYPLDNVPNATAAYGLRKLRAGYTGSAIRVRRSSDQTLTNIGFLPNGDLDIPALLTFLNDDLTTYPKPLDRVTGAVGAYSLRKIRTAYTGNAITVRRSDNNTANIGFLPNGDLDTVSLSNFCNTNSSCYVTTWYDQSGSNRNAIQPTAESQPRIVNLGALETINGRVAIRFDGVDDCLYVSAGGILANSSFNLLVARVDSGSTINLPEKATSGVPGTGGQKYLLGVPNAGTVNAGTGLSLGENGAAVFEHGGGYMPALARESMSPSNNDALVVSFNYVNKQPSLFINNKLADVGFTSLRGDLYTPIYIGGPHPQHAAYGYYKGAVGEWIQYQTDLSLSNRNTLEHDAARYYNLTLADTGYTPPLDTVPAATAAYSLRQVNSGYAGVVIRVRRSSDNTTKNIGFDAKGNLDLPALMNFCDTSSCYVTHWFDQSENNYDATQATAANQPRIVNNGILDTRRGRPTLYFDGNDYLTTGTTLAITSNAATAFAVGNMDSAAPLYARILGGKTNTAAGDSVSPLSGVFFTRNNGANQLAGWRESVARGTRGAGPDANFQATSTYDGTNHTMAINGVSGSSVATTGNFNINQLWLGAAPSLAASTYWIGNISEVILYSTAPTVVTRNRVETNQMAYYNFESQKPDTGFIVIWYDQSGNNNHLSQTKSLLQPTIRIDTKTGRPTIQFNGLDQYLTTDTTLNFTGSQATAFAVANMSSLAGANGRLFSGKANSDTYDSDTPASGIFFYHYNGTNQLGGYRQIAIKGLSPLTLNQTFQATSTYNGTSHSMRMNGVAGTSVASSGAFGINQFWMGLAPHIGSASRWGGTISEVILYPSAISGKPLEVLEQDQRSYHGTP